MGFYSFDCVHCGRSIRSRMANAGHQGWMAQAVAVFENGSVIRGEYDGYGGLERAELDFGGSFAIYHEACYEVAGCPKEVEKVSPGANDQGFFVDEPFTVFPPDYDPNAEKYQRPVRNGEKMPGRDPQRIYEEQLLSILREASSLGVLEKVGLSPDTSFAAALEAMEERSVERREEMRREMQKRREEEEARDRAEARAALEEAGFDLNDLTACVGMVLPNKLALAFRNHLDHMPESERPNIRLEFQGAPNYEAKVTLKA